jgi:dienelactone hydrolase
VLLTGCLQLDGFLHNNIPCTDVGRATCEDADNAFDAICTACEDPYDWSQEYPWHGSLLADGEAVRGLADDNVESFSVATTDGKGDLDVVFVAAHGEDPDRGRITLLYNHGNYAGIDHYRVRVRYLHELGFNVLIWDYRGYGKSTPHQVPTPEEWFDDANLIWAAAQERAPDPDAVAVYGYSLGAIPGIEQALSQQPCALVLEAPFTGLEAIVEASGGLGMPGSMLTSGAYENRDKIADWAGPLLLMAADGDELFDVDALQTFSQAATQADPLLVEVVSGAVHGVSGGGIPEQGLAAYGALLDAGLDACLR